MSLKPWYKVATPREDLREAKPLDASEFEDHRGDGHNGSAPADVGVLALKSGQRF